MAMMCAPRTHCAAAGDGAGRKGGPQGAIADIVQVRVPICSPASLLRAALPSSRWRCGIVRDGRAGNKPWPGLHRSPEASIICPVSAPLGEILL